MRPSITHTLASVVFFSFTVSCAPMHPPARAVGDTPTAIAAAAPSDAPPPLGRLPDTVQPLAYTLNLALDPNETHFAGQVRIVIKVNEPTRTIWLHGQDIVVHQATVASTTGTVIPVKYTQVSPDGVARIDLPDVLPAGVATLAVSYTASFNTQLDGLYRVVVDDTPYIVSQFEPVAARRALVCFDEPRFKTPFDVTLRVPAGVTAISNSPALGEQTSEQNPRAKIVAFQPTLPLPTYLLAFAVGPFDVVEGPVMEKNAWRDQPVPLRGIAVRGQGKSFGYALEHTGALVAQLESYFQLPYPFPKLDVIAVPDFAAGAMENAGAITFRDWLVLLDAGSASARQKRSFAYVMSHELAHQWFGDWVTMPWWDDLWLNESFATWMGYRNVHTWDPTLHADTSYIAGMFGAMRGDSLQAARQIRQPAANVGDIAAAFDSITYDKGGGVLGMFESYLGAEAMRAGVRAHLEKYRFASATAADFLASLAHGSGHDITASFNSFLNQPGVPNVHVHVDCTENGAQLQLRQERYRPVGSPLPPGGMWHIPFCYRVGLPTGVERRCVMMTQPTQDVALPACPSFVMPNAEGAGYYRWHLETRELEHLQHAALTPREQLSLADSLSASYAAGQAHADEVAAALAPLATSDVRAVVIAPMGWMRHLQETALINDGAALAASQAWVRRVYQPVLAKIGLRPTPGEPSERAVLRQDVVGFLISAGDDKDLQQQLAKYGLAYAGFQHDGNVHTDAVPADLADVAVAAAVNTVGPQFVNAAFDLLRRSHDATVRRVLIAGLGGAHTVAAASAVRSHVLEPYVHANEVVPLFAGQLHRPWLQADAWGWFKQQFEAIRTRMPSHAFQNMPGLAEGFCRAAAAEEVSAFFTPRLQQLPGAARTLAQTTEAIHLCAAELALQGETARRYFASAAR